MDLTRQFSELRSSGARADAANRFVATPIQGFVRHRIGIDLQGFPCLLIGVPATPPTASSYAPVVLAHFSLQERVECRVTSPTGESEVGSFALIRCTDLDEDLWQYFLEAAVAVVAIVGPEPTDEAIRGAIGRFVELFRALEHPARKTIQGYWAELLVLSLATNVEFAAEAWHALPDDRFDFNAGRQRIEVKAAIGRGREHHFSLEQLDVPGGVSVYVCSVWIERAALGASCASLMQRIKSRLSGRADLSAKLDRITALTLGSNWRDAINESFDEQIARDSVRFYEGGSIPRPSVPDGAGISQVRFTVDISPLESIDSHRRQTAGDLLALFN